MELSQEFRADERFVRLTAPSASNPTRQRARRRPLPFRTLTASTQLIEFSLEPNPDANDDKNLPPQKLSFAFSTADVVVLGWRLGLIADCLRDNRLSAICILPKRYAELERNSAFVSAITVTSVSK